MHVCCVLFHAGMPLIVRCRRRACLLVLGLFAHLMSTSHFGDILVCFDVCVCLHVLMLPHVHVCFHMYVCVVLVVHIA